MQTAEQEKQTENTSKDELEEISDLESEAEGLDSRIETHKKRLKDIIKRLAELYEKKFIREGKPIKTICTTICKRFPNNKHIRSYARRHLDKKYLMWTYEKKYENADHESVDKSTLDPTSEEYKVECDEVGQAFEKIKNIPGDLDKSQDLKEIRHNADICYQYIRKCDDLTEKTGQELIPTHKRYGASKFLRKKFDPEEAEKALTEAAPPLVNDEHKEKAKHLLKGLREFAYDILSVADNMERNNYFADQEIIDECTLALNTERKLWTPLKDKKHLYGHEQYIKIMNDYKKQSARYASNGSAIMLPKILPKKYSDLVDPVLLGLLEGGKISRQLKEYSREITGLKVFLFATCNDIMFMHKHERPLLNRCDIITVPALDYKTFLFVAGKRLQKERGIDNEDIARYIAWRVYSDLGKETDIRKCIRLARKSYARNKDITKDVIDSVVSDLKQVRFTL